MSPVQQTVARQASYISTTWSSDHAIPSRYYDIIKQEPIKSIISQRIDLQVGHDGGTTEEGTHGNHAGRAGSRVGVGAGRGRGRSVGGLGGGSLDGGGERSLLGARGGGELGGEAVNVGGDGGDGRVDGAGHVGGGGGGLGGALGDNVGGGRGNVGGGRGNVGAGGGGVGAEVGGPGLDVAAGVGGRGGGVGDDALGAGLDVVADGGNVVAEISLGQLASCIHQRRYSSAGDGRTLTTAAMARRAMLENFILMVLCW